MGEEETSQCTFEKKNAVSWLVNSSAEIKMRSIVEASQEYWADIKVKNRRKHIHDCY